MLKKESIAITGASGFVGARLMEYYHSRGIKVRALVRGPLSFNSPDVFLGDLLNIHGLTNFLSGISTVVNLVGRFEPPYEEQLKGNVLTLYNLCEASLRTGVKKIVHISAAAVYGEPSSEHAFHEDDVPNPDTSYGLAKRLAEEVAHFFSQNYGLKFIIIRPVNVYGPGTDHGVVFNMIKSVQKSGEVTVHGDGLQRRDFLFVDDLISAIDRSIQYKTNFEIFNASCGSNFSLLDLIKTLEKILGKKIPINFKGEAQGAQVIMADNRKIKELFGWTPKYGLEEGLRETLKYYEKQPISA